MVGCITPWNYPLHQIALKVAPALAAGNTVVLKPSEVAPINAFVLAEIIHEAVCRRRLQPRHGPRPGRRRGHRRPSRGRHGELHRQHPRRQARRRGGGQTVKKVALELGGKSANVILDDADFGKAVSDGVGKCFLNSGQTCTALTRMLVPRDRLAEAEAIAAGTADAAFKPGDPMADGVFIGPLVSAAQRDRVQGFIRTGIDEGATLVYGGADAPEGLEQGYYVRPTIFSNVTPDMTIAQEEIFARCCRSCRTTPRTRPSARQRHHLRPRRRCVERRPRARQGGGPASCAPVRSRSTVAPSTCRPRSVATSRVASAGRPAPSVWRSSWRSRPSSSERREFGEVMRDT